MSQDFIGTIIPPKWRSDYLGGAMNNVIAFMKKCGLRNDQFIKSGSTCIVWNYTPPAVTPVTSVTSVPLVIKLCTKRIEYFKSFPNVGVTNFKSLINDRFKGMLLPIHEVLYEDQNYFVYTQEKIRILDFSEITPAVYNKILDVTKAMFGQGILTCDLISSNFGWGRDKQLYLLDYHDMKPVREFFQKTRWSKIVRCLLEFTSYLLHKKSFEAYTGQNMLDWKSEIYIVTKQFGAEYFPRHFVMLFKSFATNDQEIIIKYITWCQKMICGEQGHSEQKEEGMIFVPSASRHVHVVKPEKQAKSEPEQAKHKHEHKHEHKHKHEHGH